MNTKDGEKHHCPLKYCNMCIERNYRCVFMTNGGFNICNNLQYVKDKPKVN